MPRSSPSGQRDERLREVAGEGGAAHLVVHDAQLVALARRGASIVSTKLRPPAPNSHEERTTRWCWFASAVARSPASFEWPYA